MLLTIINDRSHASHTFQVTAPGNPESVVLAEKARLVGSGIVGGALPLVEMGR